MNKAAFKGNLECDVVGASVYARTDLDHMAWPDHGYVTRARSTLGDVPPSKVNMVNMEKTAEKCFESVTSQKFS